MNAGGAHPGRFPTTRWTLILSARAGDEQRRLALDTLFAAYWRPVYLYLPFSLCLFLAGVIACQFWVMPRAVGALLETVRP